MHVFQGFRHLVPAHLPGSGDAAVILAGVKMENARVGCPDGTLTGSTPNRLEGRINIKNMCGAAVEHPIFSNICLRDVFPSSKFLRYVRDFSSLIADMTI